MMHSQIFNPTVRSVFTGPSENKVVRILEYLVSLHLDSLRNLVCASGGVMPFGTSRCG